MARWRSGRVEPWVLTFVRMRVLVGGNRQTYPHRSNLPHTSPRSMSWEARAQSFRAWMYGKKLSTLRGHSGQGRQRTRVREASNSCYCIHIRFHRPSACLSLQIARSWRSFCFPLIALLCQGYDGHFSPKGEGYSVTSLSPVGRGRAKRG